MSMTSEFFQGSKIPQNADTTAMMDFLSTPESVNKMIVASELGLPAITPVVKELEERFGSCESAPLNHQGANQNAVHRQNIGRMTKFVMSQFGYIPVDGGLNERARIPKYAQSKYFSTAAVYQKLRTAKYSIAVTIV
jgi:hypothetical protein